ncbi:hypothetical protein J2X20_002492 [Pelomonas saccharophila]|uniref:Uncharacterized protein n=1 Tax=Roseateles saccharophilus TaxID=304 RepID=A0ABU1YMA2_ROSSA|nr:hypothetical protein [Roseateles saccharophilus]MDR7269863.1 hypothetical protein [Roseateles saccharophilus]
MGYELHVTRKEFWADDEGPEISLEEWAAYVKTDPAITLDRENPGDENYIFQFGQSSWPLWWHKRGEIYTKNPEPAVIAKLVQIAAKLDARVLGDDDEIYGRDPTDPTRPVSL